MDSQDKSLDTLLQELNEELQDAKDLREMYQDLKRQLVLKEQEIQRLTQTYRQEYIMRIYYQNQVEGKEDLL